MSERLFKLKAPFKPTGDQPEAVAKLLKPKNPQKQKNLLLRKQPKQLKLLNNH